MKGKFHISSLVVTADPMRLGMVTDAIGALEIAEIAIADPSGKLVVTLETPNEVELIQGLTDIQLMPGVASAALCYHHSESEEFSEQSDCQERLSPCP